MVVVEEQWDHQLVIGLVLKQLVEEMLLIWVELQLQYLHIQMKDMVEDMETQVETYMLVQVVVVLLVVVLLVQDILDLIHTGEQDLEETVKQQH
jgi:hypothetical protein